MSSTNEKGRIHYDIFDDKLNKNTNTISQPTPVKSVSNENTPGSVNLNMQSTTNPDIPGLVKAYVEKNKPSLFILTPCYGSVNHVNYTICLINTIKMMNEFNIPIQVSFCKNDSLVSRARNNLIAKALTDPKTTHCMFIDSDITWDPLDVIKLMVDDKDLIGGLYPLKKYNWSKLTEDKNKNVIKEWIDKKNSSGLNLAVPDEIFIQHRLLNYNFNCLDKVLTINQNLAKVRHIATGFMMIKRGTLEKMFLAFPYTKYTDDVGFLQGIENKNAYALFDCGVEDEHYYSEDWLFCHRWSKMGGDIYVNVSINLQHTGSEDYNGSFILSVI
jgi:hypothetical protein